MRLSLKKHSVLPGFGLSLGYTLTYLSLIVLLPLSMLFFRAAAMPVEKFWEAATDPRVLAAYRLTFGAALAAAVANAVMGFVVAWSLVRYRFPGRKVIDALVDLPFALPTAVSGIALTAVYAKNGWIGQWLEPLGLRTAYSPLGITIALTFIGFPFVVRTMQPAFEELEAEAEEAAACLGASGWATFSKVIFPAVLPALLTGFSLAFARALGEYGSVVFISGNMPMKTEIVSLLIIAKLDQYDTAGATAIAVVMLLASFMLLLAINLLQWWAGEGRRQGAAR